MHTVHPRSPPACPAVTGAAAGPGREVPSEAGVSLSRPCSEPSAGVSALLAALDSELWQPVISSSRWRHPGPLLPTERSQIIFTGLNE